MKKTLLPFLLALPIFLQSQSFNTNGSASNLGGGCYQLTPDQSGQSGNILSSSTIDLNLPFFISATLNFGNKDANGADGFVFMFTTTNSIVGTGGGMMGYAGITPSVAIEWDDYQNGDLGDPAEDHAAIYSNGNVSHLAPTSLVGPIPLPNVEDGQDHCVNISWDPSSNTLTGTLDGNTISYSGNIIASIFGGNSNVYWGFSSATGSLSNPHKICFSPPTITPMMDITICPGQSAPLQADPTGLTWNWAPNPTLSATNISNPIATPTMTTTYFVTIGLACGGQGIDDVIVNVSPPPPAMASNNSPVCEGEVISLTASGGTSYAWSGPGFSSNEQDPLILPASLSNIGVYTVTVTNAAGCTATATTTVTVDLLPVVAIVPEPLPFCEDAPPHTMSAVPPGGVWGGVANATGQIDPAALGAGTHPVTYTFTDANGCTNTAQTTIQVVPLPIVAIIPTGTFCTNDPVQTLSALPSGGIWGGVANPFGEINPATLGPGMHLVTYEYFDGNGCYNSTTSTVEILTGISPVIQPAGPFCASDPPQNLTANPPGGTWGGVANAFGEINPTMLGPGTHLVTYEFVPQNGCPGMTSTTIVVQPIPTAIISGGGTFCLGNAAGVPLTITATGAAPLEVTYLINGSAPTSITVPAGTTTFPATIAGNYTILNVIDNNGCSNSGNGSATVTVVDAPEISMLTKVCDATNTNYVVSFTISGGDPSSYSVTPLNGTLTTSPPYIFTSNPIAGGTPYSFTVNDANNCDPTILSGSHSCLCTTDAGTMNTATLTACVGDSVTATHNGNEILDGNDNLVFVLHSSNGNSLGMVFATSNGLVFGLVPPMMTGVTYYISAVAGDGDGSGGVDLDDPCLSVSFGTPVVFNPLPTGSIADDAEICAGESATLSFSLSGNAPFDVSYSNGTQTLNLNNILNNHTITVSPTVTTTYSLLSVSDNSNPACAISDGNSVTVSVFQAATVNQSQEICAGDSTFLEGAWQVVAGTYHDTLATVNGCDSIIVTALVVNELDTTYLSGTSCNPANIGTFVETLSDQNGCDSTIIRTVVFSQTDTFNIQSTTCDPALDGVFLNTYTTQDGCDSTVIETVLLLQSDTTYLTDTSCDPANVGSFTTILTNQNGCDSTVILTVSFSQTDTTFFNSTTCEPTAAGVFTNSFTTPDGCDSTVVETVLLLQSDTTYLDDTSCDPANVGMFTTILTNQNGCDSTVILTVAFSESDTTLLQSTTCDPTLAGVFTDTYTSQDGCDSTVIETVVLLQSDTTLLQSGTCDPTATGTFTTILTNQNGCDSTLIETVSLLASDTTFLQSETCDPAATGTFTTILTNQNGCDSTLIETVSLLPSDTTFLQSETCDAAATGTFTTILTNQNGCDSTVILTVTLLPASECGVVAGATGSTIPCEETSGAITLTVTLGEAPFTFVWTGTGTTTFGNGTIANIGTPTIVSNLSAGNYSVTITSAAGFSTTVQAQVIQLTAPVLTVEIVSDFGGYAISCTGESDGSALASAVGGVTPYNYSWSNGALTAAVHNLAVGNYAVTVTDANGCTDASQISLNEPLPLVVSFVVNDLDCFGQNNGNVSVVAQGGTPPYLYAINGGASQNSSQFVGLAAGTFEITVLDANGCEKSEFIGINAPVPVDVQLGDDQSIKIGEDVTLQALINLPFDSLAAVLWTNLDSVECPTCLEQNVVPLFTTTYSIAVTAENGCKDKDDVTIFVDRRRQVYIPNAFSPNGDGINDAFVIYAKPNVVAKIKRFLVFDRWGETVFEYYNFQPNDPAYGWEGKLRGQFVNPAVFAWFAEIEFVGGETGLFEGDVTVVR